MTDLNGPGQSFVDPSFVPPAELETPDFRLRPLGPEHNVSDYAAWTSSLEHIHASPGWEGSDWPMPMTLEANRADLERHAADFVARTGFTYTVLAPDSDEVIGCVYIYPAKDGPGARVRSWVRASDAHLDRDFMMRSRPGSIATGRSATSTTRSDNAAPTSYGLGRIGRLNRIRRCAQAPIPSAGLDWSGASGRDSGVIPQVPASQSLIGPDRGRSTQPADV